MKEMMKGCLQLKQQFLSEIKGLTMPHLGHVGRMVSLSLKGLERTVSDPSYIS